MSAERYDANRRTVSNLSNKQEFNSRISDAVERVHSIRGLQIVAGICQVVLGVAVLAASAAGSVSPLWLATLFSVAGSISSVAGVAFLYTGVIRNSPVESLVRNAIHRIMHDRN